VKNTVLVFMCLFANSVFAGPFGLDMGYQFEKLDRGKEISPNYFLVNSVPKPNRFFETYAVEATPEAGVCFIKALSNDINTSVYGEGLRSEFKKMAGMIANKYGLPTKEVDRLTDGSIWDEPRDYMMSLKKRERTLWSMWGTSEGADLPNNIASIFLMAQARKTNVALLTLEYQFNNGDDCEKSTAVGDSESL